MVRVVPQSAAGRDSICALRLTAAAARPSAGVFGLVPRRGCPREEESPPKGPQHNPALEPVVCSVQSALHMARGLGDDRPLQHVSSSAGSFASLGFRRSRSRGAQGSQPGKVAQINRCQLADAHPSRHRELVNSVDLSYGSTGLDPPVAELPQKMRQMIMRVRVARCAPA